MGERESKILRRAATVRRADALFKAMSTDYLLREQFITGPTEVLSEYLYGRQIDPEQAAAGNLLLYAVVANDDLRSWIHGYALLHRRNVPSGEEFAKDFAAAASKFGGDGMAAALAEVDQYKVKFDEDLLHFLFNIGLLSEDSAADGVRPAAGAGELIASTLTAITLTTLVTSTTGTGTGTGTNPFTRSPFTAGTVPMVAAPTVFGQFAPGYVMGTLDALTHYATGLRAAGALGGS